MMKTMLESAEELNKWVLECTYEPDGYDMTEVPVSSDRNYRKLLDSHNDLVVKYNQLVEVVNQMLDIKVSTRK